MQENYGSIQKQYNSGSLKIIESICQHIHYKDQNKDDIDRQLKQVFDEGNQKITARKAKLNTKASAKKRKQDNKQDEHNTNKEESVTVNI